MIGVLMHKAFFISLRVSRLLPVAIMGKDPQFGNPIDRGFGICFAATKAFLLSTTMIFVDN
jgi:hypothetical protein